MKSPWFNTIKVYYIFIIPSNIYFWSSDFSPSTNSWPRLHSSWSFNFFNKRLLRTISFQHEAERGRGKREVLFNRSGIKVAYPLSQNSFSQPHLSTRGAGKCGLAVCPTKIKSGFTNHLPISGTNFNFSLQVFP